MFLVVDRLPSLGKAAQHSLCDPFTRLRHEVALKSVTTEHNQDVTLCSAVGTLSRCATEVIRWCESLETM